MIMTDEHIIARAREKMTNYAGYTDAVVKVSVLDESFCKADVNQVPSPSAPVPCHIVYFKMNEERQWKLFGLDRFKP